MIKMKGVELTTSTIILIVLGLIVLISFILLVGGSKAQVDIIAVREALRNCCGDRSVYDCEPTTDITLINCRVPWGDSMTLDELRIKAGLSTDQLPNFCFCPQSQT
jgi:hypothetical protein